MHIMQPLIKKLRLPWFVPRSQVATWGVPKKPSLAYFRADSPPTKPPQPAFPPQQRPVTSSIITLVSSQVHNIPRLCTYFNNI